MVCDEIVGAVSSKLLPLEKVVKLIKDKPDQVDLVLTGHHAPKKLIDLANLATEMVELRHPFKKGIMARKGIDF